MGLDYLVGDNVKVHCETNIFMHQDELEMMKL